MAGFSRFAVCSCRLAEPMSARPASELELATSKAVSAAVIDFPPELAAIVASFLKRFSFTAHLLRTHGFRLMKSIADSLCYFVEPARKSKIKPGGAGTGSDSASGGGDREAGPAAVKDWLIVAHRDPDLFVRVSLSEQDRKMEKFHAVGFAGSGVSGFAHGYSSNEARFSNPAVCCVDPTRPDSYFLADQTSIRHFDAKRRTVSALVGGKDTENTSGVGQNARFNRVVSLLSTSDGATIWIADWGNRALRRLDVADRCVTTVYCDEDRIGKPEQIVWDRSPDAEPESAILIASGNGIFRFHIVSGTCTTVLTGYVVDGLQCTATGSILFVRGTIDPGLYGLDRRNDQLVTKLLALRLNAVVLAERARCLFVVSGGRIHRIDLPPEYLPMPHCCECDR